MLNVLILIQHLGRGGMEQMAVRTAELLKNHCRIHFMVFEAVENGYPVSVPVINLDKKITSNPVTKLANTLGRIRGLRRYEKANAIDVCLSFGEVGNLVNAFGRKGVRALFSVRGFTSIPQTPAAQRIWRLLYRRAHRVLCVSNAIANALAAATGLAPAKFATLYNFCDGVELRHLADEPCELEAAFPTLLYVGRLEEVKGPDLLLEAFALLLKRRPDARLLYVGGGSLERALKARANALGIQGRVVFAGQQTNPYRFFKAADIFVLPSRNEGFPNAMVEAMACGLPVAAADCLSGPREILAPGTSHTAVNTEHATYGLLVPPQHWGGIGDAFAVTLATAVDTLIEDGTLRTHYAQMSRRRAADFSPEAYLSDLTVYLEEAM